MGSLTEFKHLSMVYLQEALVLFRLLLFATANNTTCHVLKSWETSEGIETLHKFISSCEYVLFLVQQNQCSADVMTAALTVYAAVLTTSYRQI